MNVGILFSGGKDSCLALSKAMKEHEICCLISIISKNKESFMFHTPNIWITKMQAESIGIPLISFDTEGRKEIELKDLEKAIIEAKKKYNIEGIVTGAVRSAYQSSRIQKICKKLGLKCVNPLWQSDEEQHWKEILDNKFKVIISSIAADGLEEEWLGKIIDKDNFEKLKFLSKKFHFNLAFEGGEGETTVLFGPMFKREIKILKARNILENKHVGQFKIEKAELVEK